MKEAGWANSWGSGYTLLGRLPMIARCLSLDPSGEPRVDPDT